MEDALKFSEILSIFSNLQRSGSSCSTFKQGPANPWDQLYLKLAISLLLRALNVLKSFEWQQAKTMLDKWTNFFLLNQKGPQGISFCRTWPWFDRAWICFTKKGLPMFLSSVRKIVFVLWIKYRLFRIAKKVVDSRSFWSDGWKRANRYQSFFFFTFHLWTYTFIS